MFGMRCLAFRFANVVGPFQTHGVGYDFLRRLRKDPTQLSILGNGLQSKSYVYVTDIIQGVLLAEEKHGEGFDVFNISTPDAINVNEIAQITMKILEINPAGVALHYSGGDRGWKADVPIVRLSAEKLSSIGWKPKFDSLGAIAESVASMNSQLSD
jgi:UDP-glucose 4-epimerase